MGRAASVAAEVAGDLVEKIVDRVYQRTLQPSHAIQLAQAELAMHESAMLDQVPLAAREFREAHERVLAETKHLAAQVGLVLATLDEETRNPEECAGLIIRRLGLREVSRRPSLLRTRYLLDGHRAAAAAERSRPVPHLTLVHSRSQSIQSAERRLTAARN